MRDFRAQLAEKATILDEALHVYLQQRGDYPPVIYEAMHYSVFAGGKRLRAALTMAAAEAGAGGCSGRRVLPAACAVELIHTYSLIHDDLPAMDNDDLRRGKPTNHRIFGEATAILAGSALLVLAFELLAGDTRNEGFKPHLVLQVVQEMAVACGTFGLIGGQIVDIASATREIDAGELDYIHRAKTGALFLAAVRAGAILGGASPLELERLSGFAEFFGLAFQITDDILDVIGEAEKTGKAVGSDVRNGKHTYVSFYGIEEARRRAEQACARAQAAIEELGPEADFLRQAAEFIVVRDF